MYVGEKVTATQQKEDLRIFACTTCATESTAFVVGVGQGQGNSAFFLDSEGAHHRAHHNAEKAAQKNADLTLSLARCPACGQRNTWPVARFWLRYAGATLGGTAFIWTIGAVVYALEGSEAALWIFGPLGPVTGGIIGWMELWKWTTVDRRVSFVADPPAESAGQQPT